MQKLPLALDPKDYEWTAGRVVKQFMNISVLESSDTLRTLGAGMVEITAVVDDETDSKLSIVAPILVIGEGPSYSEAWEGDISIDYRQPTHVVLSRQGEVVESRHIYDGLENMDETYKTVFTDEKNRTELYQALGYEQERSYIDADKDYEDGILALPIRFFPTVYTSAKEVFTLVKDTRDLIQHGGKFADRGAFTQYILLLTHRNRWVLCVRTANTERLLPLEGVINETIRTFEYGQDDQIITYFLESGFDPFDQDIDDMSEAIARQALNDE